MICLISDEGLHGTNDPWTTKIHLLKVQSVYFKERTDIFMNVDSGLVLQIRSITNTFYFSSDRDYEYSIYPKYWDRHNLSKQCRPRSEPQNVISDQGLYCLPLV